MDGLYLKDAKGKYITEGKYPLIVSYNVPNAYINGMKVGKVTLPQKYGENASLVNY